jgi:hypothetical protein
LFPGFCSYFFDVNYKTYFFFRGLLVFVDTVSNCFQQIQAGPLEEVQELGKGAQNMTEWGGLTEVESARSFRPRSM